VSAIQATRGALRDWTPPDASLGFQIVAAQKQAPVSVLRPAR
jgi:hypothetical protein